MISKIDQQWLRSFHCVYENLSIKRASDFLSLPTSNISRHIRLLEEQLDTRLFDRTTRKIAPTNAGEQLYILTQPLLSKLNDALEEVTNQSRQATGQLKILMPDSPILANAVVSFCQQHPSISICCDTSVSPKEDLFDGFDVILKFHRGKLADSSLVAREIQRWPSAVVGSPELLSGYPKPSKITDLQYLPCISSLTAVNGTPWVFKSNGDEVMIQKVKSCFKVNSGHLAKAGAVAGLGLAILPIEHCQDEIRSGTLQVIDMEYQPEDLILYAFYASQKHVANRIPMFIEHIKHYAHFDS